MGIVELVKGFCKENDYSYRGDYSGRGMYGKECIGVVCDDTNEALVGLCKYVVQNGHPEYLDDLDIAYTDNMALQYILYFPCIEDKVA